MASSSTKSLVENFGKNSYKIRPPQSNSPINIQFIAYLEIPKYCKKTTIEVFRLVLSSSSDSVL